MTHEVESRIWRIGEDTPHRHRCSNCRHLIDCGVCAKKWPTERHDLVERLIGAERRARVAEQALRDRMNEPDDRSLALAQQARIDELTGIVERLNQTIARKKAS